MSYEEDFGSCFPDFLSSPDHTRPDSPASPPAEAFTSAMPPPVPTTAYRSDSDAVRIKGNRSPPPLMHLGNELAESPPTEPPTMMSPRVRQLSRATESERQRRVSAADSQMQEQVIQDSIAAELSRTKNEIERLSPRGRVGIKPNLLEMPQDNELPPASDEDDDEANLTHDSIANSLNDESRFSGQAFSGYSPRPDFIQVSPMSRLKNNMRQDIASKKTAQGTMDFTKKKVQPQRRVGRTGSSGQRSNSSNLLRMALAHSMSPTSSPSAHNVHSPDRGPPGSPTSRLVTPKNARSIKTRPANLELPVGSETPSADDTQSHKYTPRTQFKKTKNFSPRPSGVGGMASPQNLLRLKVTKNIREPNPIPIRATPTRLLGPMRTHSTGSPLWKEIMSPRPGAKATGAGGRMAPVTSERSSRGSYSPRPRSITSKSPQSFLRNKFKQTHGGH